jgi:glutamate synthase (NADPH/NADH) small chain
LPCDLALVAIGQARLRELLRGFPGVELDEKGHVLADPGSGRTGHPRVYAGGDALNGGELVVTAAQDGKRAARAICAQCGIAVTKDAPLMAGRR